MFAVYLFATIVGGVLLAASVVSGGHHGSSDASGGHGHDAQHGGGNPLSIIFSVRLWTYLLAFGGATGLILTSLVGTSAALAAIAAASVGVSSGVMAHTLVRRLGSEAIGGTVGDQELVGRTGQLLLPVGKQTSGKVRLTIRNQAVDLIATSEEDLPAREEVLIVEVKSGSAVVARNPIAADSIKK
jgi:membrane protein implicated in regulation of membrane protease activity